MTRTDVRKSEEYSFITKTTATLPKVIKTTRRVDKKANIKSQQENSSIYKSPLENETEALNVSEAKRNKEYADKIDTKSQPDSFNETPVRKPGVRRKKPSSSVRHSLFTLARAEKTEKIVRQASVMSADLISVEEEKPSRPKADKFTNADGTRMSTEDYMKAVRVLQTQGQLPIPNFGLNNQATFNLF